MHAWSSLIVWQCHRRRSLDEFFGGILSGSVKLAVVGCGCSVATEPVAEISHEWNISQVTIKILSGVERMSIATCMYNMRISGARQF